MSKYTDVVRSQAVIVGEEKYTYGLRGKQGRAL